MTSEPQRTRTLEGILLMGAAFTLLPMMDAVGKYLTRDYHTFQIIWARYFFQAICLSAIVFARRPLSVMRTRKPGIQFARAFFGWASNIPFIFALMFIPLADAVAGMMIGPLIVTALSVPMLGEKVGARRWCAVVVGLAGTLIVIRPGLGLMHWAISLPILTAVCFALFQIFTRRLSGIEDNDATLMFGSYGAVLLSVPFLPFVWRTPDLAGWGFMALMGLLFAGAHLTIVRALHFAAASVLAPFAYAQILSATVLGLIIFGDFPDRWTLAGATIICGSGLYVAHRERRQARSGIPTSDVGIMSRIVDRDCAGPPSSAKRS